MSLGVTSGIGTTSGAFVTLNASPVNLFGSIIADTSGRHGITDNSGALNVNISGGSVSINSGVAVSVSGDIVLIISGGAIQVSGTVRALISGDTVLSRVASNVRTTSLQTITNNSGGTNLPSGSTISVTVINLSGNKDMFVASSGSPYSGFGGWLPGGASYTLNITNFNLLSVFATTSGQLLSVVGVDL